jgi:hypothetical protein
VSLSDDPLDGHTFQGRKARNIGNCRNQAITLKPLPRGAF